MRSRAFWVLALAFAGLQLHGAVLGRTLFLRDTTTGWLPQAASFVHCLGEGSLPLWDPYAGFGRPLLADPRAAVLYPFTWLNLVLDPATFYALFAIVHVALGGLGLARLARALGASRAGAALAAAVFMAGGPFLSLVAMWNHLAGAAFVPWVIWAFLRAARAPSRRRVAAAAALLALQVLVGSPEMTALAALGVATCGLLVRRAQATPARVRASAGALAAGAVLGLALGAAQWLPTLDLVKRSTRSDFSRASALFWSLHPAGVVETLVPARWFDQELTPAGRRDLAEGRVPFLPSIYVGATSALLVVAALCRRRRETLVPAAMIVAGTLLALGRHTPVYAAAVSWIPIVNSFRFPVKALVLAAVGWSLLAGLGFDRLRAGERRERLAAVAAAATLLAALGAVALVLEDAVSLPAALRVWIEAPRAPATAVLLGAGAALLGTALLVARPSRSGRSWWAVGGLACLDLTCAHWTLNPTAPRSLWSYRPALVDTLDRAGFARTLVQTYADEGVPEAAREHAYTVARAPVGFSEPEASILGLMETLHPPLGARWRVFGAFEKDVVGFDPRASTALRDRFRRGSPEEQLALLRLAAVRSVVGLLRERVHGLLTPVAELPGFFVEPVRVFRVEDPRPRAFLVDGVRVGDGAAALLDPSFEPARDVLLPEGESRAAGSVAAGGATITRVRCNAVTVEVQAAVPAHLVLVDVFDPGWRATVDGAAAGVARANVAFRAVAVPAGRHTVEWSYLPRGLLAGALVSLVGVAVASMLATRRNVP